MIHCCLFSIQFLHQVVDGMCGHCKPRYQDYGKVWNIDQWYDVVSTYENFIKSCAKRGLTSDEVSMFTTMVKILSMNLENECMNFITKKCIDLSALQTLHLNVGLQAPAHFAGFC